MRKINSRSIIVILFAVFSIGLTTLFLLSFRDDAAKSWSEAVPLSQDELDQALEEHANWVKAGNCVPDSATGIADIGAPGFQYEPVDTSFSAQSFFMKDLSGLDLSNKVLRCARFIGSSLTNASLFGSDLRGAIFTQSTLKDAELGESDLRGTVFNFTELADVNFEPTENPQVHKISLARNLDKIKYSESPQSIYKLKKAFSENGYVTQEKLIIAALNRGMLPQSGFSNFASNVLQTTGFWIKKILFEYTCEFGANALLPLIWIYVLFVVFSGVYLLGLSSKSRSGIYVVFPERVSFQEKPSSINKKMSRVSFYKRLELAMAFSLRSALRLGFQNFDFGRWVRMLQHREYDVIAVGWLRPLSAIQSLLSIYLIALAILSGFGKPFNL